MIKAILMRLFGLKPLWEVRTVNRLIKKDLPGTRLYHGTNYRKALAAYKKEKARMKPDHLIKLQGVLINQQHWRVSRETVQELANGEANQRLDNITEAIGKKPGWSEPEVQELKDNIDGPGHGPEINAESEPWASQRREAAEIEASLPVPPTPDEVAAELHSCNYSGPMVMQDDGKYHASCSICGEVR